MTLRDMDILVVGAGALGLASAAAFALKGARVTVFDRAERPANASAVAAGMLAPVFEAVLEEADAGRAALYRAGRDLWPAFAEACGIELIQDGAEWVGPAEPLAGRARGLGFTVEPTAAGWRTPDDWRLTPLQALEAMRTTVRARGGRLVTAGVVGIETDPLQVVDETGRSFPADAVVVAVGWTGAPPDGPAELARLMGLVEPIKGQILELGGEGAHAVTGVVRAPGVYLLPRAGRVIVGATMEPGVTDCEVEAETVARLRAAAVAVVPELASAEVVHAQAGVRGAVPDGLPIAGAVPGAPGVFVALGPRRNGWLLAPLAAQTLTAAAAGETPGPHAAAIGPDRFGRACP
ncbi:FAD-binding oxidoreductase [Caulobacter sp. 17J80-11]|uniref:NAD(P)/FAD-dependent oxidoreductase n=1 Tax=Caulobacter sp. 17J80-11 TaxID=2763502 RepID=UPI001653CDC4|nr:FAD-dependent oxidoreductase [Caulobacter sp. 17J80-11]MBC6982718.1 FAD-dependent oxidoreductase [Caulobacter sp. 17J80-11]